MSRCSRRGVAAGLALASMALQPTLVLANDVPTSGSLLPPWTDRNDVPLAAGIRSIVPKKDELPVFMEPGRVSARRGTLPRGSRAPLFATRRGPSCTGRWLNVGPLAWVCSDQANFSDEAPQPAPNLSFGASDGLPYRYFFVGKEGAYAWDRLDRASDDSPDAEIDPGFAVAAVEERTAFGERWIKTSKGRWVSLRYLSAAHPSAFSGELLSKAESRLDFGWIVVDRSVPRAKPSAASKAMGIRVRFERVAIAEVRGSGPNAWLRVSKDGEPDAWVIGRDIARPSMGPRPNELEEGERWIDVELATQTLVAYEGDRPVFSTLVSTGRGPQGSETATPIGTSRVWVKLHTSTMDNLERRDDGDSASAASAAGEREDDEASRLYSLDDVPYVQFFNKAVALHGVFWHRNFGRVQSHGCVNLAPKDARYLFEFTGPHLPRGWSAALPTPVDKGTLVRVR